MELTELNTLWFLPSRRSRDFLLLIDGWSYQVFQVLGQDHACVLLSKYFCRRKYLRHFAQKDYDSLFYPYNPSGVISPCTDVGLVWQTWSSLVKSTKVATKIESILDTLLTYHKNLFKWQSTHFHSQRQWEPKTWVKNYIWRDKHDSYRLRSEFQPINLAFV